MLGRALCNSVRICTCGPTINRQIINTDFCFASSDSSSNGPSKLNEVAEQDNASSTKPNLKKNELLRAVDIIGENMYTVVKEVAQDLYKDDKEMRNRTQKELIEKLAEHEKETFDTATASQMHELMSDKAVVDMLADINAMKPKSVSHAAKIRHARRGLVLLRKEIFYQAQQNGYSAEEARSIAQHAVEIAEARAIAKSQNESAERMEALKKEEEQIEKRDEKERRLFAYAFEMAEKMLSPETASSGGNYFSEGSIEPYLFGENVFSINGPDLGVFDKRSLSEMREHNLKLWHDLDANSIRIWNQLFGPKNGFEELIEWTKKGKMWPYPINNEYLLGDEEKVGFHEHVFLQKELAHFKLPKSGPIAHFMELVCVGLSKNSYMTITKKRDHLKWFANFFNDKKVEEVHRLHKAEQEAVA